MDSVEKSAESKQLCVKLGVKFREKQSIKCK